MKLLRFHIAYLNLSLCFLAPKCSDAQAIIESWELRTQTIDGRSVECLDTIPYTGPVVKYFQPGKLKYKANYRDGLLHGSYVSYNYLGRKAAKGNYENGARTGFWSFNCEDDDFEPCQYVGGHRIKHTYAFFEHGTPKGRWKLTTETGKILYKTHQFYGHNDVLQRYVVTNENGDTLEADSRPSDLLFEEHDAIPSNYILLRNKDVRLVDKYSGISMVNPIHADAHPNSNYFDGFQQPFTGTVLKLWKPDQAKIRVKAVIENGKLVSVQYWDRAGNPTKGYLDVGQEE